MSRAWAGIAAIVVAGCLLAFLAFGRAERRASWAARGGPPRWAEATAPAPRLDWPRGRGR